MGARIGFSLEQQSPVVCFVITFLFSDECCEAFLDVEEKCFESREVFPVESPGLGTDDLPLFLLDSVLVDGEPSGVISMTPLSKDIKLGRLLNWVLCTTVGSSSCPLRIAAENLRLGLIGGDISATEAVETIVCVSLSIMESLEHTYHCFARNVRQ